MELPAQAPAARARAGYHSRVCSITGDAIDRITAAIDQLAQDVRADSGSPEHTARLADIWLMIAAIDPDLARVIQRYAEPAGPADGADLD